MFAYYPMFACEVHVYCGYKQVMLHTEKTNAQIGTFGFCQRSDRKKEIWNRQKK
jgi:hypothetical protein